MKVKKWLAVVGIILLLLFIAGVFTVQYILTNRFKEVLQLVISEETDNHYSFDASKVDVSLFKKKVIVRDAVLKCIDTTGIQYYYNAGFKELFLSIHSWRELYYKRRLTIDSLSIRDPTFFSYDKSDTEKEESNFHLSDIVKSLDKALGYLQLKALAISNGKMELRHANNPGSLTAQGINLSIKNFSQKKNPEKHFLFSDDVDLDIGQQVILLPSGMHEIAFNRMHFSGRNQFFELDSFSMSSTPANPHQLKVNTSEVYFNSSDLTSIYKKDEIVLDTLLVIKPVIEIEKQKKYSDTVHTIHETTKALLAGLRFKYVSIEGGSLNILREGDLKKIYGTDLMNVRIRELAVNKETKKITAESIELDQRNISFLTRDSLFELNVGEFRFAHNELLLKNAAFGPTVMNHNKRGLTFKTPLLKLHDVSVEDLLLKRLKARGAELITPDIVLLSNPSAKTKDTSGMSKSDLFYKTLDDLHEIIKVDSFRIINGNLVVKSVKGKEKSLKMQSLNSLILLNRFFESDSLVMIKRSMPELKIAHVDFINDKLKLELENYEFIGTARQSHVDNFKLKLANNTTIEGEKLSWEIFDWDLMENYRIIQVDHIAVKYLDIISDNYNQQKDHSHRKNLPVIRLARVDIDSLRFTDQSPEGTIQFNGNDFCVDEVNSVKSFLTWNHLEGMINDLGIVNKNTSVVIDNININNHYRHVLNNITVKMPNNELSIPVVTAMADFNTSDFSVLNIEQLDIENGQLKHKKENIEVAIPDLDITLKHMQVSKDANKKMLIYSDVTASLDKMDLNVERPDSTSIVVRNASAGFRDNSFSSDKINLPYILKNSFVSKGEIEYAGKKINASAGTINWNIKKNTLSFGDFNISPKETMEEKFMRVGAQTDYMLVKGKSVSIEDIKLKRSGQDSGAIVGKIVLDEVSLNTTRDKRYPYVPGAEKLMPTAMIKGVKYPVTVETVEVNNGSIIINEISGITNKEGSIPLRGVNATLINVSNRENKYDSLYLTAELRLFNNYVRAFNYSESYEDSLSSFRLNFSASPMTLREYNKITKPLVSASIERGIADTLYASWTGNKHAAIGQMTFKYSKLKVRLLDKKNPEKRGFLLNVENALANALVIKNKNDKSSTMYFVRDKNRSVFNYWVKTKLSGVIGSIVKMKDRKNKKQYNKHKEEYHLDKLPISLQSN